MSTAHFHANPPPKVQMAASACRYLIDLARDMGEPPGGRRVGVVLPNGAVTEQ
jgi:hypothetical protein